MFPALKHLKKKIKHVSSECEHDLIFEQTYFFITALCLLDFFTA